MLSVPNLLGILYLMYEYPVFRQFKLSLIIVSENACHKGMHLPLFNHKLPNVVDCKSVFACVCSHVCA